MLLSNKGSVLKRVLTYKSIVKDEAAKGKNSGLRVQEILDMGDYNYLHYIYFNYSKFDFIPEILARLKITGKFIIHKPGKNPELFEEFRNQFESKPISYQTRNHFKSKAKYRKIHAYNTFVNTESKGILQAKNHGKL